MIKKFLAAVCTVAMLSSAIAGCSKKDDLKDAPKTTNSSTSTQQGNGYTLPIVKEPVTITLATMDNYYSPKSYTQNLPVWQEIEKKTGVKIKWDVSPSAQYVTVMKTRLAASTDLPDIAMLPSEPYNYVRGGLLTPLNDLIDQYAPNIKKLFKDDPRIEKLTRFPDGKVYSLSVLTEASDKTNPNGWIIRKDWLNKLNLKEPETIDDWYKVLKAFKENDPNGNKQADELPLVIRNGVKDLLSFGCAWGLHLGAGSQGYYPDATGKVQFDWLNPDGKAFLAWLNKLYKEGLLDPDFAAVAGKEDQYQARIVSDKAGSTMHFVMNLLTFQNTMKAKIPDAQWSAAIPPKSSNGQNGFIEKYGPIARYYSIINTSKNKEVCIKWLDYVYGSDEGNTYQTFGIEGLSYKVENGKKVLTDFVLKNTDGLGPTEALRSIGAWPNVLYRQSVEVNTAMNGPEAEALAKKTVPYLIDKFPAIIQTEEETNELRKDAPDLQTYIDETVLKFIIGQEHLDNYDKFIKRIKDLGIDTVLKVKQAQYDRYMKN